MSMFSQVFISLLVASAGAHSVSSVTKSTPPGPVVNTTLGPVRGFTKVVNAVELNVFRGIPFAATTGGENRFNPPKPREPWSDVFDATQYGPGCSQSRHNADVPTLQSEDCLNVNIYCPKSSKPLPVMFFIHGGSYEEGSNKGAFELYEGSNMASTNQVCVVSTNYRLGAFGFLVTEEQVGNQGILDQRMALEWVRDNIHNFGGDEHSVTIWGESAGAMSVFMHMVSPGSKGLFHRAIQESNPAGFRYQKHTSQHATFAKKFSELVNCTQDDMACLRALPVENVLKAGSDAVSDARTVIIDRIMEGGFLEDAIALNWAPVVDGVVIPDQPLDIVASGKFNVVPLLIGTNQDEAATFVYAGLDDPLPESLYPVAMQAVFGKDGGKQVLDFYSEVSSTWTDFRDSLSYVMTDFWFKCATEYIAANVVKNGGHAYVYRFDHVLSFPELFPAYGLPVVCENRTCHATELPFVFDNKANFTFTSDEDAMAEDFLKYWGAFGRSGHVNQGGGATVYWDSFNTTSRRNMRMAVPRSMESTKSGQTGTLVTKECDFFDQIGYNH